tara:strand:- start:598 stop:1038 length:441 start_codon:yes stop_codon:yes gene_type:complete
MNKSIFYFLFFFLLIFTCFVLLEASLRFYLSIKHFKNPHVNYWGKTWYSHEYNNLLVNKFDENLISNLKEVNFNKLNLPKWSKNANITINKFGFRENDNGNINFKNNKNNLSKKECEDKKLLLSKNLKNSLLSRGIQIISFENVEL